MPTLKELSCTIELGPSHAALPEHGTVYADALVETYIPVPATDQSFAIHLSGRNFIAPGIAMYVFIDGVYQCNRNRQGMKLRGPGDKRSLVDFRVRQKEESGEDGGMVAREWSFGKLGTASDAASTATENQSCIEVVVLRCAGPRNAKTPSMNLDGASDFPDYRSTRSRATGFDDRDPFSASLKPGPQYRSPNADTQRSRFSDPVSTGTWPRAIAAPGFQYGSGPIPLRPRAETQKELLDEIASSQSRAAVDPVLLEKIVADAVKRGVQESRESARSRTPSLRYREGQDDTSQTPGAWPNSPVTHRSSRSEGRSVPPTRYDASIWDHDVSRAARSRAGTHVAWDESPTWETQASGPWVSDEHAWASDETWAKPKPRTERQRSKSRARTESRRESRSIRLSEPRSRRSGWSGRSRKRPERDTWTDEVRTSSDDDAGWDRHPPSPSTSSHSDADSDSTLKPSHTRSQLHRHQCRIPSHHQQRLSRLSRLSHDQPRTQNTSWPKAPSVVVTNAPVPQYLQVQAQTASPLNTQSKAPQLLASQSMAPQSILPPPSWGCASQKPRKNSDTTFLPPAAFSTLDADEKWEESELSWGVVEKSNEEAEKGGEGSWGTEMVERWSEDEKTGWVGTSKDSWGVGSASKREVKSGGWARDTDEKAHSRTKAKTAIPTAHSKPTPRTARTAPVKSTPSTTHRAFPPPPRSTTSKQKESSTLSGPGAPYGHLVSRPLYLDTLEKPYAVFRFKCCGEHELRGMFGGSEGENGGGWTEEWVASQVQCKAGVEHEGWCGEIQG